MAIQDYFPAVPGITTRAFRGEADYAPIYTLRAICALADGVDPKAMRESIPTEADIAAGYSTTEPGDPHLLLLEADSVLIGLAQIFDWEEAGNLHVYLHLCWLLPTWRSRGIGTAMLRWCQAQIRAFTAQDSPTTTAVFATNASSTELAAKALIEADSYQLVRTLSDLCLPHIGELPPVTLPAPLVTNRPITPDSYRPIYAAFKASWRGLWSETPESEEDYQEFADDHFLHSRFDPALWQVAWDGETVAGFVAFEIADGIGYMPEVAVVPQWRRKGVARTLLVQGLQTLSGQNITEVRTFTDANNGIGARTLYESVGFRETKQHYLYRKPIDR